MATESEGVTKNLINKDKYKSKTKNIKDLNLSEVKDSITFYQVSCCDLHHHQQQHQTLGAHLVILIFPIPYEQPTLLHMSNWGLGVPLQSLPVSKKVVHK
jgi:hypothetical protein